MQHIFFEGFVSGIGWLWLNIRYRDKAHREQVLRETYKDSYKKAGGIVLIVLIVMIFIYELLVDFMPEYFNT